MREATEADLGTTYCIFRIKEGQICQSYSPEKRFTEIGDVFNSVEV